MYNTLLTKSLWKTNQGGFTKWNKKWEYKQPLTKKDLDEENLILNKLFFFAKNCQDIWHFLYISDRISNSVSVLPNNFSLICIQPKSFKNGLSKKNCSIFSLRTQLTHPKEDTLHTSLFLGSYIKSFKYQKWHDNFEIQNALKNQH